MQFDQLKRREFITLLGGAAAAWPLAAHAEQRDRVRRVGVLMALDANDPQGQSELRSLRQGFQELGWIEGRNLQFEFQWAGGEPHRIQASAKVLVGLPCEVIFARSTPVVAALLKETRTIPIVFAYVVDPVQRLRPQLCATRRQCDGISNLRIHDSRQVAAIARGNRAFGATDRDDP